MEPKLKRPNSPVKMSFVTVQNRIKLIPVSIDSAEKDIVIKEKLRPVEGAANQCEICKKVLSTKHILKSHMKTHAPKTIACDHCDKVFRTQKQHDTHKQLKHMDPSLRPLPCTLCDQRFLNKVTLDAHMNSHTREKSVSCVHCLQSFYSERDLSKHVQSRHLGILNFECAVCGRGFYGKHDMVAHMRRLHAGEDEARSRGMTKCFRCRHCPKVFTSSAGVRYHENSRHLTDTSHRPLCMTCGKTFSTQSALKNHVETHEAPPSLLCPECGRAFYLRHALTRHMRIHNREHFVCQVCGKQYTNRDAFRAHLAKHVKRGQLDEMPPTHRQLSKAGRLNCLIEANKGADVDKLLEAQNVQIKFINDSYPQRENRVETFELKAVKSSVVIRQTVKSGNKILRAVISRSFRSILKSSCLDLNLDVVTPLFSVCDDRTINRIAFVIDGVLFRQVDDRRNVQDIKGTPDVTDEVLFRQVATDTPDVGDLQDIEEIRVREVKLDILELGELPPQETSEKSILSKDVFTINRLLTRALSNCSSPVQIVPRNLSETREIFSQRKLAGTLTALQLVSSRERFSHSSGTLRPIQFVPRSESLVRSSTSSWELERAWNAFDGNIDSTLPSLGVTTFTCPRDWREFREPGDSDGVLVELTDDELRNVIELVAEGHRVERCLREVRARKSCGGPSSPGSHESLGEGFDSLLSPDSRDVGSLGKGFGSPLSPSSHDGDTLGEESMSLLDRLGEGFGSPLTPNILDGDSLREEYTSLQDSAGEESLRLQDRSLSLQDRLGEESLRLQDRSLSLQDRLGKEYQEDGYCEEPPLAEGKKKKRTYRVTREKRLRKPRLHKTLASYENKMASKKQEVEKRKEEMVKREKRLAKKREKEVIEREKEAINKREAADLKRRKKIPMKERIREQKRKNRMKKEPIPRAKNRNQIVKENGKQDESMAEKIPGDDTKMGLSRKEMGSSGSVNEPTEGTIERTVNKLVEKATKKPTKRNQKRKEFDIQAEMEEIDAQTTSGKGKTRPKQNSRPKKGKSSRTQIKIENTDVKLEDVGEMDIQIQPNGTYVENSVANVGRVVAEVAPPSIESVVVALAPLKTSKEAPPNMESVVAAVAPPSMENVVVATLPPAKSIKEATFVAPSCMESVVVTALAPPKTSVGAKIKEEPEELQSDGEFQHADDYTDSWEGFIPAPSEIESEGENERVSLSERIGRKRKKERKKKEKKKTDELLSDTDRGYENIPGLSVKKSEGDNERVALSERLGVKRKKKRKKREKEKTDKWPSDRDEGCKIDDSGDEFIPESSEKESEGEYEKVEISESEGKQKKEKRKREKKKKGREKKSSDRVESSDKYCFACDEKIPAQYSMSQHIREKHGNTKATPHACKLCDKVLANIHTLKLHMEVVHFKGNKHFSCHHCGKEFIDKFKIKAHIEYVHLKLRPYQCDLCEWAFYTQACLRKHRVYHTGEKNYICHLCSKAFYKSCELKNHLDLHVGELNYFCNLCGDMFVLKKNLAVHLRRHAEKPDGIRIYRSRAKELKPGLSKPQPKTTCEQCNRQLATHGSLLRHIQAIHMKAKPRVQPPLVPKKYRCTECPNSYDHNTTFSRHLLREHGKRRSGGKCPVCGRNLLNDVTVMRHMLLHHPDNCENIEEMRAVVAKSLQLKEKLRVISCPICRRKFTKEKGMQKHMATKHQVKADYSPLNPEPYSVSGPSLILTQSISHA